ncbi:hypothetical protein FHG66_08560 [Rubellimicrobium rubrum]|uniref:Uncharacterized protein n=1 Tax=Rubellimicrobium rubrum TaxID=2585369 RepID=A0A5C4N255_9RHOB|nr:hypothetical protein [Rubellimicrobium rubrum]TNC50532.1 hypothetical protein FHG66_08560 [Rubellimicrobium rubrum]
MAVIADFTVHQARRLSRAFQLAYDEHAQRMRLLAMTPLGLTCQCDGDYILMDIAACMSIALSLPRLGLTARVLRRLKAEDARAYRQLQVAALAYAGSADLRAELGHIAVVPFQWLQALFAELARDEPALGAIGASVRPWTA